MSYRFKPISLTGVRLMNHEISATNVSRRAFLAALGAAMPLPLRAADDSCRELKVGHVYSCRTFTAKGSGVEGLQHQVFTAAPMPPADIRRDVIVLHEITGANAAFFQYVDTLVDEGFTVHCPVLFSTPLPRFPRTLFVPFAACLGSGFTCFTRTESSRVNTWLVELADDIAGSEKRKLGVIGMCLTGIQPLAMLRCRSVVAPVLCQPTLPTRDVRVTHPPASTGRPISFMTISTDPELDRDLGLPPSDVDFALARVRDENMSVLLIRFQHDPIAAASRATRLVEMFKPRLELFELKGHYHSSLVNNHGDHSGRRRVSEFLKTHL